MIFYSTSPRAFSVNPFAACLLLGVTSLVGTAPPLVIPHQLQYSIAVLFKFLLFHIAKTSRWNKVWCREVFFPARRVHADIQLEATYFDFILVFSFDTRLYVNQFVISWLHNEFIDTELTCYRGPFALLNFVSP